MKNLTKLDNMISNKDKKHIKFNNNNFSTPAKITTNYPLLSKKKSSNNNDEAMNNLYLESLSNHSIWQKKITDDFDSESENIGSIIKPKKMKYPNISNFDFDREERKNTLSVKNGLEMLRSNENEDKSQNSKKNEEKQSKNNKSKKKNKQIISSNKFNNIQSSGEISVQNNGNEFNMNANLNLNLKKNHLSKNKNVEEKKLNNALLNYSPISNKHKNNIGNKNKINFHDFSSKEKYEFKLNTYEDEEINFSSDVNSCNLESLNNITYFSNNNININLKQKSFSKIISESGNFETSSVISLEISKTKNILENPFSKNSTKRQNSPLLSNDGKIEDKKINYKFNIPKDIKAINLNETNIGDPNSFTSKILNTNDFKNFPMTLNNSSLHKGEKKINTYVEILDNLKDHYFDDKLKSKRNKENYIFLKCSQEIKEEKSPLPTIEERINKTQNILNSKRRNFDSNTKQEAINKNN